MASSVTFDSNWHKIIRDIQSLETTGRKLQRDFIDIASYGIVQVLKENTPSDSGELANSWKVFEKSLKYFVVGTDLTDKFLAVVNGTKPTMVVAKNAKAMHFFIDGEEFFRIRVNLKGSGAVDFVSPIARAMDEMIEVLILSLVKRHWKIFKDISAPNVTKVNLSKTVGLTGTKINKRRGRGGGVQKAKTGRKSFKRTLSRRRRTGKFITSKNAKLG